MKRTVLSIFVIILFFSFGCGQNPENIAELTAPIVFSMAKNLVSQNKYKGEIKVNITYSNLKMGDSDWPVGEIKFIVESSEYKGKTAAVQYILDGTHNATAIVEMPGKDKKQFKVNLYESAIVFGQTKSVEQKLVELSNSLSKNLKPGLKIAIFEFVGLLDQETILGKRISESLITHLSNNKFNIVERKLLDPVLKEFQFQETGLTAQNSVEPHPSGQDIRTKIGQFLGADSILIGTLKSEKEEILINARVIELQSGVILSTAQTIIPKYLVKKSDLDSLRKGLSIMEY